MVMDIKSCSTQYTHTWTTAGVKGDVQTNQRLCHNGTRACTSGLRASVALDVRWAAMRSMDERARSHAGDHSAKARRALCNACCSGVRVALQKREYGGLNKTAT